MSFMRAVCLGFCSTNTLYDKPLSVDIRSSVVTNLSGVLIQRDLFSAFLARYIVENKLSLQDAIDAYPGMESSLLAAWQQSNVPVTNDIKTNCERVVFDESRLAHPPSEQFANYDEQHGQIGGQCSDRKAV